MSSELRGVTDFRTSSETREFSSVRELSSDTLDRDTSSDFRDSRNFSTDFGDGGAVDLLPSEVSVPRVLIKKGFFLFT